MPKDLRVDGLIEGKWAPLKEVKGNYQRLVRASLDEQVCGVRVTLQATYGANASNLYAFYAE
jgi:hypothetical protein